MRGISQSCKRVTGGRNEKKIWAQGKKVEGKAVYMEMQFICILPAISSVLMA